jgi:hypothetical protein
MIACHKLDCMSSIAMHSGVIDGSGDNQRDTRLSPSELQSESGHDMDTIRWAVVCDERQFFCGRSKSVEITQITDHILLDCN